MSNYQAVYDAVRQSLGNPDINGTIRDVAWSHFDISHLKAIAQETLDRVQYESLRPSVMFRPRLMQDGNSWIALYGDNIQEGCVGCGDSPREAMEDFDESWNKKTAMFSVATT